MLDPLISHTTKIHTRLKVTLHYEPKWFTQLELNPFTPGSGQYVTSPYIIHTLSTR